MKQEAEQKLIKKSIIVKEEGFAIAKIPFVLNHEENLKNNRQAALGMLNSVLKKYCKTPEERRKFYEALKKKLDKKYLVFINDLNPWNIQFKDSPSTPIRTSWG